MNPPEPEQLAPWQPTGHGGWRPGAGRPRRDDWQAHFLAEIQRHGKIGRACLAVGIDPKTQWAERQRDPAFSEAFDYADQLYVESLEDVLEAQSRGLIKGDPVGVIVRLKAKDPAHYIERHVVASLSLTGTLGDVSADDARSLLGAMLHGNLSGATQHALEPASETAEPADFTPLNAAADADTTPQGASRA